MGGEIWDAPNQQVVRPDQSGPWDEGSGGSQSAAPEQQIQVDDMTKAQLLAYADEHGIDVDDTMTRAELRAQLSGAVV
jgi:hypothetical protein